MHSEQTTDMRILADARRGLGLETGEAYGEAAERARRVEFYTRQVSQGGCIRSWLPRTQPCRGHRHGRFAFGDALLRHRAG